MACTFMLSFILSGSEDANVESWALSQPATQQGRGVG